MRDNYGMTGVVFTSEGMGKREIAGALNGMRPHMTYEPYPHPQQGPDGPSEFKEPNIDNPMEGGKEKPFGLPREGANLHKMALGQPQSREISRHDEMKEDHLVEQKAGFVHGNVDGRPSYMSEHGMMKAGGNGRPASREEKRELRSSDKY